MKEYPTGDALRQATPVYATAKNTAAVRRGFEVGGYVKYYRIPALHTLVKEKKA